MEYLHALTSKNLLTDVKQISRSGVICDSDIFVLFGFYRSHLFTMLQGQLREATALCYGKTSKQASKWLTSLEYLEDVQSDSIKNQYVYFLVPIKAFRHT